MRNTFYMPIVNSYTQFHSKSRSEQNSERELFLIVITLCPFPNHIQLQRDKHHQQLHIARHMTDDMIAN